VASNGFAYLFGRLVITAIFYLAKNREVVFLDIRKANLIFGFCLYCIFVKNTIYVLEIDMLRPALLGKILLIWVESFGDPIKIKTLWS